MLHVVLAAFPPVISLSCSAKAFNSLLHKRMLHSHDDEHAGVGLQGCKLHSGTALKELAGPVCRRSLPLHLTPVLIYQSDIHSQAAPFPQGGGGTAGSRSLTPRPSPLPLAPNTPGTSRTRVHQRAARPVKQQEQQDHNTLSTHACRQFPCMACMQLLVMPSHAFALRACCLGGRMLLTAWVPR